MGVFNFQSLMFDNNLFDTGVPGRLPVIKFRFHESSGPTFRFHNCGSRLPIYFVVIGYWIQQAFDQAILLEQAFKNSPSKTRCWGFYYKWDIRKLGAVTVVQRRFDFKSYCGLIFVLFIFIYIHITIPGIPCFAIQGSCRVMIVY